MFKKVSLLFSLFAVVTVTGASCVSFGGDKATGVMGIYRSSDQGENWQPAMTFPTVEGVKNLSGVNTYKMYRDPGDNNAVYLTTRGQGLFYTYDNGTSWSQVDKFKGQFIYGFAIDPKDKCTLYVSNGPNIYKTVDCSRTWEIIYREERPGEKVVGLAVDYNDSNTVYAAEQGGDVFISSNAGSSWALNHRFGLQLRDMKADPLTHGRIYVASYSNGLYRLDGYGGEWVGIQEPLKAFSSSNQFYRLVLHPSQKDSLFWVSKYGILRSDDAGQTWNVIHLLTPPGSVNIYGFGLSYSDENVMYYTGTILGGKNEHVRSVFYKTEDGGTNWVTKKLPTDTIPAFMLVHPENGNLIFMSFMTLGSK